MSPRRLSGPFVVLVAVVTLSGCGASLSSASSREADEHAEVASTVMTRTTYPIPSNDAAATVVGSVNDTTIDAMAVEGTAWDGAVTLRITVEIEASGWEERDRTVRCYRYVFDHDAVDPVTYSVVDCPSGSPVVLAPPVQLDTSEAAVADLVAALSAIPSAERTTSQVQAVLTARYPPPIASVVNADASGGQTFGVGWTGSCLTGTVPAVGAATVEAPPRLTRQGG